MTDYPFCAATIHWADRGVESPKEFAEVVARIAPLTIPKLETVGGRVVQKMKYDLSDASLPRYWIAEIEGIPVNGHEVESSIQWMNIGKAPHKVKSISQSAGTIHNAKYENIMSLRDRLKNGKIGDWHADLLKELELEATYTSYVFLVGDKEVGKIVNEDFSDHPYLWAKKIEDENKGVYEVLSLGTCNTLRTCKIDSVAGILNMPSNNTIYGVTDGNPSPFANWIVKRILRTS